MNKQAERLFLDCLFRTAKPRIDEETSAVEPGHAFEHRCAFSCSEVCECYYQAEALWQAADHGVSFRDVFQIEHEKLGLEISDEDLVIIKAANSGEPVDPTYVTFYKTYNLVKEPPVDPMRLKASALVNECLDEIIAPKRGEPGEDGYIRTPISWDEVAEAERIAAGRWDADANGVAFSSVYETFDEIFSTGKQNNGSPA